MLYIVATPIGNLEDVTARALRVLKEADFVLAEDTRVTGRLLSHFGIEKPLVSFFEHNETGRIESIIEKLASGQNVALVSSAGTPTISDPGYKLVRACRARGIPVTAAPGPCSIVTALSLTSLPHEHFAFLGYVPRKDGARKKLFERIKGIGVTSVLFESPFRLIKTLDVARQVLPEARIACVRELTKKFEEVFEGSPGEAGEYFRKKTPRGEFVIVIACGAE